MINYLSISHRLLTKYLNDGIIYSTESMNSLFPDRFEYINDKMCHHIPLTSEKIFFDDSHILLELDLVKIKKLKYHRILPVNIIKSIYCLDKEKKETYTPHIRDVEINTDLLVQKIKIIDEIDRVINIDYDVEKSRLNKEINIKLRFYFKLMGGMSYLKTSSLFSRLHISSLSSFYKEYLNEFNHEKVFVEPNVSIPWQIQLFFTLSNKKYINYMLFNKEYSVIWKTFLLLSTPLYENEISSCIKSNKMLIHQYIDKVLNYSGEKGVHGFDFTNFKEDIVKLDKNAITFNDIVNNYSLIKNDEYLPIFILLCIYKHPSLSKKSSDSESIKNLIKAQNFNSKYEDELLALTLFFIGVYFGYPYIRDNQNITPKLINSLDLDTRKEFKKILKVKINPFSFFETNMYKYYVDTTFNIFTKEKDIKINYNYQIQNSENVELLDEVNITNSIINRYKIISGSIDSCSYEFFEIKIVDKFEEIVNKIIDLANSKKLTYKKDKRLIVSILDLVVYEKSFGSYIEISSDDEEIIILNLTNFKRLLNLIKDDNRYRNKVIYTHLKEVKTNLL